MEALASKAGLLQYSEGSMREFESPRVGIKVRRFIHESEQRENRPWCKGSSTQWSFRDIFESTI